MTRTMFIIIALLPLACDPTAESGQGAKTSASKSSGRSVDEAAKADVEEPAKITFRSLSECMLSCEQEHVISTNRATCRLNCDSAYGAPQTEIVSAGAAAEAAAADPVGRAATCMEGCYARSRGVTDVCVGACKGEVSGAPNSPGMNVLDHLGGCIAACHDDRALSMTNRATCELNCEQSARVAGPHASR